jgi:hypothetical protein
MERTAILNALEKIDFEIVEDDLELFVSYCLIHYYSYNAPLPLETKLPKYFKFLLKEIIPYL